MNPNKYPPAVNDELAYPGALSVGSKGVGVKRVQEWLSYHGFATAIDSDFGSATAAALSAFQQKKKISLNSTVDDVTWKDLIEPIVNALEDGTGAQLDDRITSIAKNHLSMEPREFGGDNRGPWVRIYTGGHEGTEWKWCAGFVTFIMRQACIELDTPMPVAGSLSCDTLAAQAKEKQRLVTSENVVANGAAWQGLGGAYIFLVRNGAGDWRHTGFGFRGPTGAFGTIEGNTNDNGTDNGFEVCARMRAAAGKDFVRLI